MRMVGIAFVILAFSILARLSFWQLIEGGKLSREARAQQLSGSEFGAQRGNIFSSDGSPLAASSEAWLVYADITKTDKSPKEIANLLAPLLVEDDVEREELLREVLRVQAMLERDVVWTPLKDKVTTDVKKNIEALGISGIGFELVEDRIYPEASVAAHVLGIVGKESEGGDRGYFGLEGYYDLTLGGQTGYVEREADLLGQPILSGVERQISASPGIDLVTHIDKRIQLLAQRSLAAGIERYGAISGSVIIMRPSDGAILAMSVLPDFDPGSFENYSNRDFRNPVISDSFEPGSIFKPVIMASALDAGVVRPDTECDICGEPLKVDKYFIKTWNDEYKKDITMAEVLRESNNVGMAFVGDRLGKELTHDYLVKFGFGQKTGIDLQGEMSPKLRNRDDWNVVDLAATSFGQGIAVTPIQMIRAIAAIANDGVLVMPQVVNSVSADGWEDDIEPISQRRVISKKAADEVTDMMVSAAKQGEAKWAVPRGFDIAGKTGTAQIPVEGHYDEDKTIASFVGFAPASDPEFVMLVTLREPQSSPWASETAAPLWFDIALELFPYLGIGPDR